MEPITYIVSTDRIRQLGSNRGYQMNGTEAEAFLRLFRGQIEDMLSQSTKSFVEAKLGIRPARKS